jgi:hypothetical protein
MARGDGDKVESEPTYQDKEKLLEGYLRKVRELAGEVSPITPDMVVAAPTWRAAYSDRTAALMAALCQIAYDRFEDKSHGGATREAMALRLGRGGFRLIATYDPNSCTQAYLAVSDQFAVLAFRGTTDAEDWKVNLSAGLEPIDPAEPAVRVHKGFLHAFRVVEKAIRKDLAEHVPPSRGLYISGHSLGGALAQIASAALARDNLAACYTFGSPRVGRRDFDDLVKCPHYRVVNGADLVPAVPPMGWRGYMHSGDTRWLRRLGDRPGRRSRPALYEIGWAVYALAARIVTRKFRLIDDHMIWNYKAKLLAVADMHARFDDVEPIGEHEIRARFEAAILRAARTHDRLLARDVEASLLRMAAAAAKQVAALPREGGERLARLTQGEVAFPRLVEEMIDEQRASAGNAPTPAADAKKKLLELPMLKKALDSMGPYPPYW